MAKSDFDKLYKEFVSKAKMANKNIKKIVETFGENTWAVKKLKWRLENPKYNGWTKGGRISLSKPNSMEELRARLSAVEKFNKSKTHTVRGIKKIIKETKERIREKLNDYNFNPTDDEIEALYEAFEDDDVQFFVNKIGASEFWYEVQDAREHNDTYDDFFERLVKYFEESTIDDDFRDRVSNIYYTYVVGN